MILRDWISYYSCQCLAGFDGPRCQITKQGFDGTGYAIYNKLQQCENSLTSIEIITTKANGLILYSGPVTNIDENDPQDFMYLQLVGGYPQLVLDHGSGSVTLTLNGRNSAGQLKMGALSDGSWHRIDIRRQGKVQRERDRESTSFVILNLDRLHVVKGITKIFRIVLLFTFPEC